MHENIASKKISDERRFLRRNVIPERITETAIVVLNKSRPVTPTSTSRSTKPLSAIQTG